MISCTQCETSIPDSTNFCPYCGTGVQDYRPRVTELLALEPSESAQTIQETAVMVDDSAMVEARAAQHIAVLVEREEQAPTVLSNPALAQFQDIALPLEDMDFEPIRPPLRAYAAVTTSIVLIAATIGFAIFQIPESAPTPIVEVAEVEAAPVAEPAPALIGVLPSEFSTKVGDDMQVRINHLESTLATIYSFKGSRYDSLDKRAEAVQLRLQHVASSTHATTSVPRFDTRKQGNVYEVVWVRGEQKFRILDITKSDFRSSQKHGDAAKSQAKLAERVSANLNQVFAPAPVPNS